MAFFNSKSLLMIFIFSLLLLNNVSSQSYYSPSRFGSPSPSASLPSNPPSEKSPGPSPEIVSFNFPFFQTQDYSLVSVRGDASIRGGALSLSGKDNLGNPIQNSIGRAQYRTPIHLWDRATGNLADFSTKFTFLVNPKGSSLNADGFAFFLAPTYSSIPAGSYGGYLGLFNPQTAINSTFWNQIVAVEFDTFVNEWDPISTENDNHIGIDVNSIRSSLSAPLPDLDYGIAYATVRYNSKGKTLSALITSKADPSRSTEIIHIVDLRTVLPEWVYVGFSAATGQLVETHDIFTWSFEAVL